MSNFFNNHCQRIDYSWQSVDELHKLRKTSIDASINWLFCNVYIKKATVITFRVNSSIIRRTVFVHYTQKKRKIFQTLCETLEKEERRQEKRKTRVCCA